MHFGEYELFPSLIGLSPLPTSHPKTFQRQRVRSSTMCYHSFNLLMGRSLGFASTTANLRPIQTRFRYGSSAERINQASNGNSQAHYAKGTPSPLRAPTACKHMVSGSISLPYSGFFSPFPHGTGSLSVSQEYLALPDGPGKFMQGFTCPALLRIPLSISSLTYTGLSPSWVLLSSRFQFASHRMSRSYYPCIAVTIQVWAAPRSLATTSGITFVFFSSGYLDVSVLRVCSPYGVTCLQHAGLPHSDICGSQCMCHSPQLFAAYHVLLRL